MRYYEGTRSLDLHTLEAIYKMVKGDSDKQWIGFLIANKKRLG